MRGLRFAGATAGFALAVTALPSIAVAARPAGERAVPAAACPGSNLVPTPDNLPRVRGALLCLVNAERARRDLPALRAKAVLRAAATRHSADMVRRRYFAHFTPNGTGPGARFARLGYRRGTASENIGWGSNEFSTASSTFSDWMHSAGHRANILSRRWRASGIGIVLGAPEPLGPGEAGATYTQVFATR